MKDVEEVPAEKVWLSVEEIKKAASSPSRIERGGPPSAGPLRLPGFRETHWRSLPVHGPLNAF